MCPDDRVQTGVQVKTIVLASRKGGAGKTTLASALGVEAERAGAGPVGFVDMDPMQGLAAWWDARAAQTPMLLRPDPDLDTALSAMREHGVALAIVDTAPSIDAGIHAIVARADLVVVPVQPSPDDLRAVGSTVELVARAGKPLAFVINRVKPRVRLTLETVVALSQHGPVATTQIADRTSYASAKLDGLTAPEAEPAGLAGAEIAALWTYLAARLEKSS